MEEVEEEIPQAKPNQIPALAKIQERRKPKPRRKLVGENFPRRINPRKIHKKEKKKTNINQKP